MPEIVYEIFIVYLALMMCVSLTSKLFFLFPKFLMFYNKISNNMLSKNWFWSWTKKRKSSLDKWGFLNVKTENKMSCKNLVNFLI